ncbi:RDD family protein [Streptomyces sp. NBC_00859]|uniref:RDD family protein n=1 Tax=Streptomyces sp. NBC_00859 TaxID=2903682 RepID=UPI003865C867|nr:RDD family protein [Streptomyces sp. NBC_00859]
MSDESVRNRPALSERDPVSGTRPEWAAVDYVLPGSEAGVRPSGGGVPVVELASVWRRIGARVFDQVLVGIIALIAAGAIVESVSDDSVWILLGPVIACPLLGCSYFVFSLRWFGTTPGKWVSGLRVARLWALPSRINGRTALVREFLFGAIMLVPGFNVLYAVLFLVKMVRDRPYHQSQYDRLASTVVVRWPRTRPLPAPGAEAAPQSRTALA